MSGFVSLGISSSLARCCTALGWEHPLPIQSSAIPPALKGSDIIGTSETGSGKTAAFLLPILQSWLNAGCPRGYALILTPTRELALQIAETAVHILSSFVGDDGTNENPLEVIRLIGGESAASQALTLAWCRHHFIVATPGRLAEHIKQSAGFARHHLSSIKHLVLDEVDRMLSLEFSDDLDLLLGLFQRPTVAKAGKTFLERRADVVAKSNPMEMEKGPTNGMKNTKFPHPQTYLFTATMSKDVRNLRRIALRKDAIICGANMAISLANQANITKSRTITVELPAGLKHYCLPVRRADKLATLEWLLETTKREVVDRTLVFCARCHETRFIAGCLAERGYRTVALTGKMKQPMRKQVLSEFVAGKANILVATDVAGRGLDLPFVSLVINYGVPLTAKSYRHRVGRTARAGRSGTAVTIVTRDEGRSYLELESELLPTKPGSKVRRCIPRWPNPMPPQSSKESSGDDVVDMETRRRLVEEAWSRAAKAIREEKARKVLERETSSEGSSSDSSGTGDADNYFDAEELANQHWASGAAGIAAYCEAKRQRRLKKRVGMGFESEALEGENKMESEDEESGNLRFDQPIKERRMAKRKANAVAVKIKRQSYRAV